MRVLIVMLAVPALLLFCSTSRSQAEENLIVNGSFEQGPDVDEFLPLDKGATDITAWVVTRGQIDLTGSHWKAAHGKRSIDLNGSPGVGGIEQTMRTVKGKTYRLTFRLSGHPGTIEAEEKIKVLAIEVGDLRKTFKFDTTGKDFDNMGWAEEGFEFTATDEKTRVEFYSLSTKDRFGGPAIDDVKVVEVGTALRSIWRGKCEAGDGKATDVELILKEDKEGNLTGTWAGIPLSGQRLGRETFFFEARTKDRDYKVVGVLEEGKLVLNYAGTPAGGGTRSYGWGTLAPAR